MWPFRCHGECDGITGTDLLGEGLERDDWRIGVGGAGVADEVLVGVAHAVGVHVIGAAEHEIGLVRPQVGHDEVGFGRVGTEEPEPVREVEAGDVRAQVCGHEEVVNPGGGLGFRGMDDENAGGVRPRDDFKPEVVGGVELGFEGCAASRFVGSATAAVPGNGRRAVRRLAVSACQSIRLSGLDPGDEGLQLAHLGLDD